MSNILFRSTKKKMVIGIWYQDSKSTSMMTKNEIIFYFFKMKGIKSIKQKKTNNNSNTAN